MAGELKLRRGPDLAQLYGAFVLVTLPLVVAAAVPALRDAPQATPLWSIGGALLLPVGASFACHAAFAKLRRRPLDPGWLMHGWLLGMLLPLALPWPLVIVATAFGVIFGSLIFGGSGRYLVSPALLGVVFIAVSYPDAFTGASASSPWPLVLAGELEPGANHALLSTPVKSIAQASPVACLLAALGLSLLGIGTWRIGAAAVGGTALGSLGFALGGLGDSAATIPLLWHWLVGYIPFCVAVVATDPSVVPVTRSGQWLYGLLIGVLVILLRLADPTHPEGTLTACLFAALFAPLIDRACEATRARMRRSST